MQPGSGAGYFADSGWYCCSRHKPSAVITSRDKHREKRGRAAWEWGEKAWKRDSAAAPSRKTPNKGCAFGGWPIHHLLMVGAWPEQAGLTSGIISL